MTAVAYVCVSSRRLFQLFTSPKTRYASNLVPVKRIVVERLKNSTISV